MARNVNGSCTDSSMMAAIRRGDVLPSRIPIGLIPAIFNRPSVISSFSSVMTVEKRLIAARFSSPKFR